MLKSVLVTNSFMFVVALISYPGLFVFNPFVGGLTVISLFQTTSLIGLAMSLAMPLWVHRDSSRTGIHLTFFLISCLLWPVSILAIRMVLFASFGDFGFSYLINFPIFVFTDYILPVTAVSLLLAENIKRRAQSRRALPRLQTQTQYGVGFENSKIFGDT